MERTKEYLQTRTNYLLQLKNEKEKAIAGASGNLCRKSIKKNINLREEWNDSALFTIGFSQVC